MSRYRVVQWSALSLALVSVPAMADPEYPFLTPEHPTADDVIVVNAYAGPCDLLQHPFEEPVVIRDGDQITIQLSGEHITDPIWCTLGWRVDQVEIGSFPRGSYMVTINWEYFNLIEDVQVTLGVLPLTIGNGVPAGGPVPLPTAGRFGLVLLGLGLVVAAVPGAHRRKHPFVTRFEGTHDNPFGPG